MKEQNLGNTKQSEEAGQNPADLGKKLQELVRQYKGIQGMEPGEEAAERAKTIKYG